MTRHVSLDAAARERLRALLARADKVYQPLYNLDPDLAPAPLRVCADRCAAVERDLGGTVEGLRILDVGSSFGYNSFHFAERGAIVHGIDTDESYVAISREVARHTRGRAEFTCESFDDGFVGALAKDAYDVAFVFNVLHHIVQARGLPYVQDLVRGLLARVATLYVELALASETPPTGYDWDLYLPPDERELFARADVESLDVIARFPTHVGPVPRPIYRVKRRGAPSEPLPVRS